MTSISTASSVPVSRELTPATLNWITKTKTCERWYRAKVVGAIAIAILITLPCAAAVAFGIYFAISYRNRGIKPIVMGIHMAIKGALFAVVSSVLTHDIYTSRHHNNYARPHIANPIVENLRTAPIDKAFQTMSPSSYAEYGFLPEAAVKPLNALLEQLREAHVKYAPIVASQEKFPGVKEYVDEYKAKQEAIQAAWVQWRQENLIDTNLLPDPNSILRA